MTSQLLPVAHALYTTEDASLGAASAQATGLPLIVITVLTARELALGLWLLLGAGAGSRRRTHRVLNGGCWCRSPWQGGGAAVAGRSVHRRPRPTC